MIDLHSPQISDGDIEVDLDLDHATITLLVAEETVIDQRELAWTGRGKVRRPTTTTRAAPAAGSG